VERRFPQARAPRRAPSRARGRCEERRGHLEASLPVARLGLLLRQPNDRVLQRREDLPARARAARAVSARAQLLSRRALRAQHKTPNGAQDTANPAGVSRTSNTKSNFPPHTPRPCQRSHRRRDGVVVHVVPAAAKHPPREQLPRLDRHGRELRAALENVAQREDVRRRRLRAPTPTVSTAASHATLSDTLSHSLTPSSDGSPCWPPPALSRRRRCPCRRSCPSLPARAARPPCRARAPR